MYLTTMLCCSFPPLQHTQNLRSLVSVSSELDGIAPTPATAETDGRDPAGSPIALS